MPLLKLKHVVSFSSEDLKHPADNILKPESYFKWKCATKGERQLSVVVQLEKSTKIHSIDIGNNGSAFVEVLVGRSSWGPNEEFKVLLAASTFMSPTDSKNNKELYRVRMFGVESFTKDGRDEKWDVVKLVCTQPYNQTETYGLSFVNIHSPPEPVEKEKEKDKTIQLGRFTLRSNSDSDEDTISTGSYFRQKKPASETPGKTMAAACRDATKLLQTNSSVNSPPTRKVVKTVGESTPAKIGISNKCRDKVASDLLNTPSSSTSASPFPKMKESPKIEKTKRKMDSSKINTKQDPPSKKTRVEEKKPVEKKVAVEKPLEKTVEVKKHVEKKKKLKKRNVPVNKILENLVFCLSGFENPERGQIRDAAQNLGAEYSPGWDNRCTHLVCAFKNTPKFRQIKGRGKIVKKEWIKECKKLKRRVNTKSFRMDGGGDSSYESTDDEEVEVEETTTTSKLPQDEKVKKSGSEQIMVERKKSTSSECDTEDELEKLRGSTKQEAEAGGGGEGSTKGDAYDCSTDEEVDDNMDGGDQKKTVDESNTDLPDFFEDKYFLIYGTMDTRDRRLLQRYITAYGGTLVDYMGPKVNYVISNDDWDDNFEEALNENNTLTFVRPTWVNKCHEKQKLVDYSPHIISKT